MEKIRESELAEIKKKLKDKGLDNDQVWGAEYERFWAIVRDLRFWFLHGVQTGAGNEKFNQKYMELRRMLGLRIPKEYVEGYCQRVLSVVSGIAI